jgi:hypothetical protein
MTKRKISETEFCRTCKVQKSSDQFHLDSRNASGLNRICKSCRSEHRKARYLKDEEYDKLLVIQNNSCAICGIHISELKTNLVVDHDYETLKVRGLLCNNCNVGLGLFRDNQEILAMAIEYLIKHEHPAPSLH